MKTFLIVVIVALALVCEYQSRVIAYQQWVIEQLVFDNMGSQDVR